MRDRMNSLVIFVATGNLAKLETFPALVVVGRGVLDVPWWEWREAIGIWAIFASTPQSHCG